MVKKKKIIKKKVLQPKKVKPKNKKIKKILVKKKVMLVKKLMKKNKPAKRISKIVIKKIKPKKIAFKKLKIKKTKSAKPVKKNILKNKRISFKIKARNKKTKKLKINKKPYKITSPTESLTDSFFKAKIKVVGIGGGGGSIVSEIGRSLDKAKFVVADTDTRIFTKKRGIKYFLFGQKLTHGLGTGLNPKLAKEAAEQEKEKITKLFNNEDLVIFVASLGGGVGSGATSVFAEANKKFNGVSFGIFTLPFKFEGKNKQRIAQKSLVELRKHLNVSIVIANEKIFKVIDSNTSITDAFSTVNKNLIESLESLIDLIYNPGVINIDFADLKTILTGNGSLAFLNTVEASGKDKLEKISKELLDNPLYQHSLKKTDFNKNKSHNFIAEKILFNIVGGKTLSMFDVDKISKMVAEQNPKAKIIFGISKNSKYKDKIKVTILITGPSIIKEKITPQIPTIIEKKENNIKKDKKIKTPEKDIKKLKTNKPKKKNNKKNSPKDKQTSTPYNIPINFENPERIRVFEELKQPEKVGTIRRSALEIKKDQEIEENKKSEQEKEWEIPAFLRIKNK